MKNLKEFKKVLQVVKEERKRIIIASILILFSTVIGLTYGYLNGAALEAITKLNIKLAITYLLIYLAASLVAFTVLYEISVLMFKKVEINLTNKLMGIVYRKVLNLPAEAFEVKTSGELINRITSDTNTLSNTFSGLLMMLINILGSLLILVYVVANSLIVFIEIVICVLILLWLSKKFNPKLKKNDEEVKTNDDAYTSIVNESIRGAREIKTLGIKNNIFTEVDKLIKDLFKLKYKQLSTDVKYEVVTDIVKNILEVGVFITCAILVYYGKVSITFFVAMTYYVYRYTWILTNLTEFNKTYQRVVVSLSRVNEILENKLFPDEKFGDKELKNIQGFIEFKNVSFAYNDNENTLEKFNLKIEPNKKIAIVGKSGQGKTTLFNLITKIFNVSSGEILIDDININDFTEKSLRDNVAIIRQDPFLFNKSIKENFKIIKPNITLKEIREYTKLAYLDDYIMSLPKKYDTILGEGGTNLSGGQKQRLAIARVLAKKSKIILFDEATSALDNESQEYVKKTIDNLVKNHTVIIIAHRFSTIKDADTIFVIDKGRITESGNHDKLLKKANIYRDLYEKDLL